MPDELRWLVDFERAVQDGLGFRVPLDDATRAGLDRLLVLGLRLAQRRERRRRPSSRRCSNITSTGRRASRSSGRGPRRTTPTGRPPGSAASTIPTRASSTRSRRYRASPRARTGSLKRDGQWLAEWLGVDTSAFLQVPGAEGRDQLEARAMQTALWPATLGYLAGTLLQPLLDERTQLAVRAFFTRFVSGRGPVPAVRIGSQPYGIMPTTAFSRLRFADGAGTRARRARRARDDGSGSHAQTGRGLAQSAARIRPSDAPFQTLLDVLGLQATSVEYRQRYAESLADLYNRANLSGAGERMLQVYAASNADAGADELLRRLGAEAGVEPEILRLFLFSAAQRLQGPLIEARPLSETAALQPVTSDERNYLQWLADAARTSLEQVRREQGFSAAPPDALLYLLLRHALMLGYWDAGVRLHVDAGLVDAPATIGMRREPAFIHVAGDDGPSESRFGVLYRNDARITGRRGHARRRVHPDGARRARRHAPPGRAARRARRAARRADRSPRTAARRARRLLLLPARRVARGSRARAARLAASR